MRPDSAGTCTCSSSRWRRWRHRDRRWRSCESATTRRSIGPGRADPPDRGGVQPQDPQRDGVRGSGRVRQALSSNRPLMPGSGYVGAPCPKRAPTSRHPIGCCRLRCPTGLHPLCDSPRSRHYVAVATRKRMLTRRGALSPNLPVVTRTLPRRKARVRRSRVSADHRSVASRRAAPSAEGQSAAAPSTLPAPIGFAFDRETVQRDARRT